MPRRIPAVKRGFPTGDFHFTAENFDFLKEKEDLQHEPGGLGPEKAVFGQDG
jgi:hypothetical protein